MANVPVFKLNTGASIPAVALGTWESPQDVVEHAVYAALNDGYRHIDGAKIYGNEEGVGRGIKKFLEEQKSKPNGVKREDIFVTTKLWLTDFHDVAGALDGSLKRLNLDYIDLYLMHWPFGLKKLPDGSNALDETTDFVQAWSQLEKLPKDKTRAVGVSNFTIKNLKKLLASANVTPAVNQVELHTSLPQPELVKWLLDGKYGFPKHDGNIILPEAYSPLARGNLDDPIVKKIAEKHHTGAANVALSWGVDRGTVVLPKSVTPARIKSNLEYVKLDEDDIAAINKIGATSEKKRYCNFNEFFPVFEE